MAAFYYKRMDTLKIIECIDTLMAIAKKSTGITPSAYRKKFHKKEFE
jgi:hypothetical protein